MDLSYNDLDAIEPAIGISKPAPSISVVGVLKPTPWILNPEFVETLE